MAIGKKSKTPFKGTKTTKSMNCKYCREIVKNVDHNVDAVTCYKCVIKLCAGIQLKVKE